MKGGANYTLIKIHPVTNKPCINTHTPEQIHTQTNGQTRHISTRIFKALHTSFSNIVALLQSGVFKVKKE